MEALRLGSKGKQVDTLQQALKKNGFSPGQADGDFGPATEAALINFQRSRNLLADGIAGPRTFAVLGLDVKKNPLGVIPKINSRLVSEMFPWTPIGNIQRNLPTVLDALTAAELTDESMVLMCLATIRAETASFEPISEGESRYNTSPSGHPFDLYDQRTDLGNVGLPDGDSYKGRGYIQLTGRHNYAIHGDNIGLGTQLVDNPELANQSDIAARLLASFIKSKERKIKEALLDDNLKTARRLVNGGRHGLRAFSATFKKGQALLA